MNIDPTTIIIPVVSILGSVLLSALGSFLYVRQARIDLVNEYEKRFNEKKWKTYLDFTTNVLKQLRLAATQDYDSESAADIELNSLTAELLLVGSDAVVIAYRQWRKFEQVNGQRDTETLNLLFRVVIEMRRDLGNSKTQVNLDHLLGMLVPNYQRSL